MDYTSDDIVRDLISAIERVGAGRYAGGEPNDSRSDKRKPIDRNLSALAGSFKLLHGHVDDFAYSLRGAGNAIGKFAGIAAIGEAFHLIIDSAQRLTSSYRKMIDVGQNFGGSMFEMARQAGASGLSLEQFTNAIEKHSTVSAILTSRQQGTSNAFTDLQKSIRQNLKAHSFYGMALGQLTDTSLDYMDVLAKTGALDRMDTNRMSGAVQNLVKSATGFAAAAGKSRDELLKSSAEIMRDPSFINWKATLPDAAQTAVDQLVLGLTSVGGKEFGQGFSKIMSDVLGASNMENPLVNAMQRAGMAGNLAVYQPLQSAAQAGKAPTGRETLGAMRKEYTAFQGNGGEERLRLMQTYDPAGARLLEEHYNQLRGLVGTEHAFQLSLDRAEAAFKRANDPITQAALEFESQFHTITGALQDSFYGGIIKNLIGTKFKNVGDATDQVDQEMKKLTEIMQPLGEVFGQFVGLVLEAIEPLSWLAKQLVNFVSAVTDFVSLIPGVNKKWATLATFAAGAGGLMALRKAMRVNSRVVNLYATSVIDHRGGFGGLGGTGSHPGQGNLNLPGGGAPGASKPGVKGWFSRNFGSSSKFAGFGKGIAGMVGGLIAGQIVNSAIDHMDIDPQTKAEIEAVINVGSVALGMFAPMLAKTILGGIATSLMTGLGPSLAAVSVADVAALVPSMAFIGAMVGAGVKAVSGNADVHNSIEDFANKHGGYHNTRSHVLSSLGFFGGDFKNDKGERLTWDQMQKMMGDEFASKKATALDRISNDDSDESLSERLKTLGIVRENDENAVKWGDKSQQTLVEIRDIIAKQQEITNLLLLHGNKISEDQLRDANRKALYP